MNAKLDALLKLPNTWQASHGPRVQSSIASGYEALDKALHYGGWPQSATTELLLPKPGGGELGLLLPALRQQQKNGGWLAFINAPWLPFLAGLQQQGIDTERLLLINTANLKELLWATDQCLASGHCSAVLTWAAGHRPHNRDLRRLQQASASGQCWHVLFREYSARNSHSPAALRLQIQSAPQGNIQVDILKQRGGWSGQTVLLQPCHHPDHPSPEQPVFLSTLPDPLKLGHDHPAVTDSPLQSSGNIARFQPRSRTESQPSKQA